ncbi:MAG: hypothetical protein KatS3mg096_338 [Candidatus Parcubacteria bacterium]|nr:MAG: hypothetical protein KatS3mg096_338 [Candidatus Parcubacteria bacterium]
MLIIETDDFKKDLDKLPKSIKRLYQKQKQIFETNWLDPRLHVKKLKEYHGVYSFRITRLYRVLFYFSGVNVIFLKINPLITRIIYIPLITLINNKSA